MFTGKNLFFEGKCVNRNSYIYLQIRFDRKFRHVRQEGGGLTETNVTKDRETYIGSTQEGTHA